MRALTEDEHPSLESFGNAMEAVSKIMRDKTKPAESVEDWAKDEVKPEPKDEVKPEPKAKEIEMVHITMSKCQFDEFQKMVDKYNAGVSSDEIELEDEVFDTISGFKGIVVGVHTYINTTQCEVQAICGTDTSKKADTMWIDINRLEKSDDK